MKAFFRGSINQWTIGRQIIRGVSFLLITILVMGCTVFFSLSYIKTTTLALTGDALPGLLLAEELRSSVFEQQLDLLRHLLSQNQEDMDVLEKRVEARRLISDKIYAEYEKTVTDEKERKDFQVVVKARQRYRQLRSELLALSRTQPLSAAEKYHRTVVRPAFEAYQNALNDLYKYNRELAFGLTQRTQKVISITASVINTLCIIGIVVGIISTILLVYKTNKVMQLLIQMAFTENKECPRASI